MERLGEYFKFKSWGFEVQVLDTLPGILHSLDVCEIRHAELRERVAHPYSWSTPLWGAVSPDSSRDGGHETFFIFLEYGKSHVCFVLHRIWHMLCQKAWLARYLSNFCPDHLTAVENVLKYFGIMRNYMIAFSGSDMRILEYSDSDFWADSDAWMSASGYLFTLNGGSVEWMDVNFEFLTPPQMLNMWRLVWLLGGCEAS